MGDFSLDLIPDLPLDLYIGGKAVPASDGGRFDVLDPATGGVIASVADGTVDDALAAVDAAARCGRDWAATAPRERVGGAAARVRADEPAQPRSSPT